MKVALALEGLRLPWATWVSRNSILLGNCQEELLKQNPELHASTKALNGICYVNTIRDFSIGNKNPCKLKALYGIWNEKN